MPTTPTYNFRYQVVTDGPHGPNLGLNLATDVENKIILVDADIAALRNVQGINNVSGSGTTTSATFVNLPATSSFSFTKQRTGSKLRVDMALTAFIATAAGTMEFGVLVNGVDYQLGKLSFNTVSEHTQMVGFHANVAPGLTAGAYTIQGRWRRAAGTGTLTVDSGDWISIVCAEV